MGTTKVEFGCCGNEAKVLSEDLADGSESAIIQNSRWDYQYTKACTDCGAVHPYVYEVDDGED